MFTLVQFSVFILGETLGQVSSQKTNVMKCPSANLGFSLPGGSAQTFNCMDVFGANELRMIVLPPTLLCMHCIINQQPFCPSPNDSYL